VIDEKGRCCGRKPLVYKRPIHYLYCCRCNSEYHFGSHEQIANWAWQKVDDKFEPTQLIKNAYPNGKKE